MCVVLTGPSGRERLLDRLALAENVRRHCDRAVAVEADRKHVDDVVDAVIAGRIDLVRYTSDTEEAHDRNAEPGPWGIRRSSPGHTGRPGSGETGPSRPRSARRANAPGCARGDHADIPMDIRRTVEPHRQHRRRTARGRPAPGDPVIMQVTNSADGVAAFYGILRAGLGRSARSPSTAATRSPRLGSRPAPSRTSSRPSCPGSTWSRSPARWPRDPDHDRARSPSRPRPARRVCAIEDLGDRGASPTDAGAARGTVERDTDLEPRRSFSCPAVRPVRRRSSRGCTPSTGTTARATASWWSLGPPTGSRSACRSCTTPVRPTRCSRRTRSAPRSCSTCRAPTTCCR